MLVLVCNPLFYVTISTAVAVEYGSLGLRVVVSGWLLCWSFLKCQFFLFLTFFATPVYRWGLSATRDCQNTSGYGCYGIRYGAYPLSICCMQNGRGIGHSPVIPDNLNCWVLISFIACGFSCSLFCGGRRGRLKFCAHYYSFVLARRPPKPKLTDFCVLMCLRFFIAASIVVQLSFPSTDFDLESLGFLVIWLDSSGEVVDGQASTTSKDVVNIAGTDVWWPW